MIPATEKRAIFSGLNRDRVVGPKDVPDEK
jgi:hypothetical protein